MERDWPAEDVGPLIALIDDPGTWSLSEDGTYRLSEAQARAILELRLQRLTGLEREKIAESWRPRREDRGLSGYSAVARAPSGSQSARRTGRDPERFGHAAPHHDRGGRVRADIEDLIQREDMVVTVTHARLHQARAAVHLPGPAPRRQGPAGMATRDEDFVSQVFVCEHPHAGAVLLVARHGLQAEGLPPAARHAPGARQGWSTCCRCRRARPSRPSCRCRKTRQHLGRPVRHVRHLIGRCGATGCPISPTMANGKIAMKLDDGDQLIGVQTCTEDEDIMLAPTAARASVSRSPMSGSSPAGRLPACAASAVGQRRRR